MTISLLPATYFHIPAERLWVNPDCGLKTRAWEETTEALKAMIQAAESLNPPHHLPLGNAAFDVGMAQLESIRKEFLAQEAVARGADFPKDA